MQKGHMLRTKQFGVDESGICEGYGGVDSLYLIN